MTTPKKPLDIALAAALADVLAEPVATALDTAARRHGGVEPHALARAASLAGSRLGRELYAREIVTLDNCLALVRAQLLLHPITAAPSAEVCDECDATYPHDAGQLQGDFHNPGCSLYVAPAQGG